MLAPEELVAAEPLDDEYVQDLTSRGWTEDELNGNAGESPGVYMDVWFAATLADGREVEGEVEAQIGTGIIEHEASADELRKLIEERKGSWALFSEERWDNLITALGQHGVVATASDLDAVERGVQLDLGHLAR